MVTRLDVLKTKLSLRNRSSKIALLLDHYEKDENPATARFENVLGGGTERPRLIVGKPSAGKSTLPGRHPRGLL